MERIYEGLITASGADVIVHDESTGGQRPGRKLDLRLDLRNHSPTGFAWGYNGSGPAQLALAIAADVLGDDQRALRVYQHLKAKVIAPLRAPTWKHSDDFFREVIAEIEKGLVT